MHAEENQENNHEHTKQGHGNKHDHQEHHRQMAEDFKKRFWISLVLTIPILLLAPIIQGALGLRQTLAFSGDSYVLFAFSVIIFIYGGKPFLTGLWSELKSRQPGMMTLIGLAITVAFVYSSAVVFGVSGRTFFWELATLIDVMLLGHWIEMKSVLGASRAMEELVQLLPSEAHRVTNGGTADVPVSELSEGDKIVIKPGERIPADGSIVEGNSDVNEAMLTGESTPVDKGEGDEVIGGSVNGDGSLTVEVQKTGEEGYLSKIVDMVSEAQSAKSRSQNLADRAAFWLTIIAISAGLVTWLAWWLGVGRAFDFALERSVTVMVITCPHALGLAIPLVVAVSTALSARNGLLIRNRNSFEQARNIQAIIFDKTGTLTQGTFGVADVFPAGETSREELLTLAASVEQKSEHPIAKAIVEETEETRDAQEFEAIKGKGAKAKVDGKNVAVVSPGYLEENNLSVPEGMTDRSGLAGKTVVYVVVDDTVLGAIALADQVRPESREAIDKIKERGITAMMVTGDNEAVARAVADELGIDEVFAGVLPDKKADKVKEVQGRDLVVAMVGDGINDAPALAQADVGVAIGAGTDVAAETADVVLVQSDPLDVVEMIRFAEATHRKMIQNLWWATGYNVVAIPLAAGVLFSLGILLSPAVGALLMSLSTVVVAVNARFLKVNDDD
ncbi:copper-translocating P-type ATPase [candidate division GN15 bacterium]|nr:copper-translocating P-type ATPase [candidate division GN15 bacterium]